MSHKKTKLILYVAISTCIILVIWLTTVKYSIQHELNNSKQTNLFGDIKISLDTAWNERPLLSASTTTTQLQGGSELTKNQFDDLIDKLEIKISTSSPTTTDLTVENPLDATNWSTYQSDKYNYSIKYPASKLNITMDTLERGTEGQPGFKFTDKGYFTLGLIKNTDNLSTQEWLDQTYKGYWADQFEEGTINGYQVFTSSPVGNYYEYEECYIEWVIFPKNNNFYTIAGEFCDDAKNNIPIFQKIISTFQFTQQ